MQTLAAGDNNPTKFLKVPWEKISEIASSLEEMQLSQSLKYGIGFIYEGMLDRDREAVEELYHAGAI